MALAASLWLVASVRLYWLYSADNSPDVALRRTNEKTCTALTPPAPAPAPCRIWSPTTT